MKKEQHQVFEQLKQVFTSRPLLVALELDKEFRVEADAFNFATKDILSINMRTISEDWLYFQIIKQNREKL